MERDGTKMNDRNGDLKRLRDYLVGSLEDDATVVELEMQLLSNDHFADEVLVIESELIEEFLDGELDDAENEKFVRHFLASPDRRRKLRLTKNLREYAEQTASVPIKIRVQNQLSVMRLIYQWRVAMAAFILLAVAIGVWQLATYQSDADRGLAELRKAYVGIRPMESRISAITDYVPYSVTRGTSVTTADAAAHDRADRYLKDATLDSTDGRSFHALALLYLTDKNYDRALQEFNKALALRPTDAVLQSDLGAAYLEIAKSKDGEKEGAKILELLNESLKHLDQSIALNPKLPEPRFNRALCLEKLNYTEQARLAWSQYLEVDPNSKWADEVRQKIQAMESNSLKERTSSELETDFLAAFRNGDENTASKLSSENRELIRDKYLPTRLATSYINAPTDRRDEFRRALLYEGQIEMKLTGDPFANQIARYYSTASESKLDLLRQAQTEIRAGIASCLDQRYEEAGGPFSSARDKFTRSGNTEEAKLAQYFLAYSMINSKQYEKAIGDLEEIRTFARSRGYRWLEATVTHWIASCFLSLSEPTEARQSFEDAASLADFVKDNYSAQRNRLGLATLYSDCGQKKEALTYLFKTFESANKNQTSFRQRYRNISVAQVILSSVQLESLAGVSSLEAVAVSDLLRDEMFIAQSRLLASATFVKIGKIPEAREFAREGKARAEAIVDEQTRQKILAHAALKFGNIELSAGDYFASQKYFAEAATYYDSVDQPLNREDAHNGLLMTYLQGQNDVELDKQLPKSIEIAETFGTRILEERQRDSYFNSRQNVYDIAADFEFKRGNNERAYDYIEMSSSRTLLDRLRSNEAGHINLPGRPLSLNAIREKMPAAVQLIEYSVLTNKVLIWVVSKEKFTVVPISIQSTELDEKVLRFSRSISHSDNLANDDSEALRREFYRLLILPIRDQLDSGNEICIVPSKALFNIPFAALVSPEGRPLIADIKLFYASSANVFLRSTENSRARSNNRPETLLAVGNPSFDRTRFNGLENVEDAAKEAVDIAAMYDSSKTLLRGDATKHAFLQNIDSADIVHFAGHYVVAPGMPSSSFLLLAGNDNGTTGSPLTNGELSLLSFPRARVVILSACQTSSETIHGEGLTGISRTLLAAGVPQVVASQWSVESRPTADLMTKFHHYRRLENESTVSALRHAQLDLMNDPTGKFSDPFYWAAFAVFGGHSAF